MTLSSSKKAIYFESINDLRSFGDISELNNNYFLIYTSSGAVIEILNKNKIKFNILNYKKIFEKLIKFEKKNFTNFYKICKQFEKKIFNNSNGFYSEINGYFLQYLYSFLLTKYTIYDHLIKEIKKKKIKKIILFNEDYDFLSLSNKINPWIEYFLKDKKLKFTIINSKKKIIRNYKTILLDYIFNLKYILISKVLKKKIIYCERLSYDLRVLKSRNYLFIPINFKKKIKTDFFWQKTLTDRKLINKKKSTENYNKNYSKFLYEFNKLIKKSNSTEKISMDLIKKPLFMMFSNFENLFSKNYNFIENFLKKNKPKSIIFNSTTHWLLKLISIIAKQKKIPVISIQHGGGYGTHDNPRNDLNDYHYSNYFLSYGKKFFYSKQGYLKFVAKIIPIGNILLSKKLEKTNLSDKKIKRSKLNILYISDGNSDNFLSYAKRKYPDLVLYKIQKKILSDLYKNDNYNITYRPFFTGNEDNIGTTKIIENNFPKIDIDNQSDIYEQIKNNDIVITDSSVGTVLTQSIVFKKKIIFINVPSITKPFKQYYNDLKNVINIIEFNKLFNTDINRFIKKIQLMKLDKKTYSKFIKDYITQYDNINDASQNFIKVLDDIIK